MSDNFDWNDCTAVVLPRRSLDAVAVYSNPHHDLVIRAQRDEYHDDDRCIIVAREGAIAVAYAVLEAAGHDDVELIRRTAGGCY
jgi:hypothetical protein